jgi:hypothetical protein
VSQPNAGMLAGKTKRKTNPKINQRLLFIIKPPLVKMVFRQPGDLLMTPGFPSQLYNWFGFARIYIL